RRMCEYIGHPVLRLKRIKIGDLALGSLKSGEYRPLTAKELKLLKSYQKTK
ncbi:MAG: pseudouridine synthase, partial [Clostridia bacterium]|nr:pseudouridine synthase [Clostridia bacterium]